MPKTIVTCFPIQESHVSQIRDCAKDDFEVIVSCQENIAKDLFQADVFCGHAKVPVDWDAIVAAGRLRWVQSSAAGLDHCLTPAVIAADEIMVSGCSGLFAPQVAEQTVCLLMGLIRRLPVFFRAQQSKEFVRRPTDDLYGKTIGILGFGGNGQRIARVLQPMCERILATDIFPDAGQSLVVEGIVEAVLPQSSLDEMLGQSDVVIVTLPLSDQNERLIDEERFKQFKPGAYLINVGRGSVVETASLVKSLSSGRLAGAGIDVVDPEPLPVDSELWDMDNVLISPHVGAQSPRRIPITIELFVQNMERFRNGDPLLNWVDKKLGYPRPEYRIDFDQYM